MLQIENCSLAIVDIQGKLAQLMHDKEILFKNTAILAQAAKILGIPILWCQQCPDSLGTTVPEIAEHLKGIEPVNKSSFSCLGDPNFKQKLHALNRSHILLAGIETHICIYQTASDLLKADYSVEIIKDAVSSRSEENKTTALDRLKAEGAAISSTEMTLFQLLKNANHPNFKQIAKLIK